jgi:hypothetical protein
VNLYDFTLPLNRIRAVNSKSDEAVSKCFPLTAGFKIKEGDPALAGLTTPLKYSGTGIHTLSISRIHPPQAG